MCSVASDHNLKENKMAANFKVVSNYTDAEMKAYFIGWAAANGDGNPPQAIIDEAVVIAKEGIAEYNAGTQEQKDAYNEYYNY